MKRLLGLGLLACVVGCQATDDRASLRPLPDNAIAGVTYAELLTRARSQSRLATEAFYVDNWMEVEDAGTALQQTARLLPKAKDIPEKHNSI